MEGHVVYTSRLSSVHLEDFKELLFFNSIQGRYRAGIIQSIETYGEPFVRSDEGSIRIHTTRLGEVQAIFALHEVPGGERPIGVAVFARSAEDTLALLHISVAEEFAADGPFAKEMVAFNLFQRVLKAARSIRGIRRVLILYGPTELSEFPVRR